MFDSYGNMIHKQNLTRYFSLKDMPTFESYNSHPIVLYKQTLSLMTVLATGPTAQIFASYCFHLFQATNRWFRFSNDAWSVLVYLANLGDLKDRETLLAEVEEYL